MDTRWDALEWPTAMKSYQIARVPIIFMLPSSSFISHQLAFCHYSFWSGWTKAADNDTNIPHKSIKMWVSYMHWSLLFPSVDTMKRKRWEGLSSRIVIPFFCLCPLQLMKDERMESDRRQSLLDNKVEDLKSQHGQLLPGVHTVSLMTIFCFSYIENCWVTCCLIDPIISGPEHYTNEG